jgi:hypothetical protein
VYVALLRDPLARAVATFYGAHRQPESVATSRRTSPRLWRREAKGSFSPDHLAHAAAFAARRGHLQPLYRLEPQWVFFAPEEWADKWHAAFSPSSASADPAKEAALLDVGETAAVGPVAAATELRRLHVLVRACVCVCVCVPPPPDTMASLPYLFWLPPFAVFAHRWDFWTVSTN